MFYYCRSSLYLFEIWNRQQLLQSGEEFTNQSLQCGVEVRPVLHWKHILSDRESAISNLQHMGISSKITMAEQHLV